MFMVGIPEGMVDADGLTIAVWCCMRKYTGEKIYNQKTYWIATKMLQYYMGLKTPRDYAAIEQSIQFLFKNKFLKGQCVQKGIYEIEEESFHIKEETFVSVSFDYVRKLFKNKSIYIIPFLLQLIKSLNYQTKIGFTSVEKFAEKLNMSVQTVGSYMEILEKLEIIYVVHNYQASSTYGYYYNQEKIRQYNKQRGVKVRNLNANFRRKVSQTYNLYVKALASGKEWDFEKVAKLYQDVLLYNENVEKPKDMSVFPVDLLKL